MTSVDTIHSVVFLDGEAIAAAVTQSAKRKVTYKPIDETDGLLSMVYDVELCQVGIEYPLASGPATFTPDDLLEAVASQNDPAVQAPRVWLGHPDDQRFHAGRTSAVGSAEPALGKVVNMRVEDEGMVLVGDIAGCPTWLAQILSSAYPSRSVEGFQAATTTTNHTWGLVITDLALLGVKWPGVTTLKDLEALYSVDGPDGVEVEEGEPMQIAAAAGSQITAQVNIEDVRREFYKVLGDLGISSWSWIRAMQLEPNEIIVDDDEGGLFRISFDIQGDKIEFGDPQSVKIKYVNASQAKDPDARGLLVNMLTRDKRVIASWDKRSESRPGSTEQETGMNPEIVKLLRAKLGLSEEQLPDDATEEQVKAAMAEPGTQADPNPTPPGVAPTETDPGGGNPSPDQVPKEPDPNNPTPQNAPDPEAVAASVPDGYVVVPKGTWAEVQANSARGAKHAVEQENTRRQGVIAAAVKEGRIAPAQKDNFVRMYETDPNGAERLLTASVADGGLMPGTIPVEARGIDPAPDTSTEAYPAEWLPEVQAAADAAPSPIIVEG